MERDGMKYKSWTIFPEYTGTGVSWKAVMGNRITNEKKTISEVKGDIDAIEDRKYVYRAYEEL